MPNAALLPLEDDDDEVLVPLGLAVEAADLAKERLIARYLTEAERSVISPSHISWCERELLSACFARPETLDEVALCADDFSVRALGLVWSAMRGLFDRGAHVSAMAVVEELMRRAQLDDVGGGSVIAGIQASLGEALEVPYHARRIREAARCRQLATVCLQTAARIKAGDSEASALAHELIARAERAVSDTEGSSPIADLRAVTEQVLRSLPALGGKRPVISTGFSAIDEKLGGGLANGELMLLAARPSMGKTSLALDVMRSMTIGRGLPVAIFSIEMTRDALVERLIASESGVNTRAMSMTTAQRSRIGEAAGRVSMAPIYLDDTPVIAIGELRARARTYKRRHGIVAVLVDYLQLANADEKDAKQQEKIAEVSKGLKQLARELQVPVVALSQLSRSNEARQNKRPVMSDLRDSGALEQDADVIAFIYRDEYYMKDRTPHDEVDKAELDVAKNRNGPTGVIPLRFEKSLARFSTWKA